MPRRSLVGVGALLVLFTSGCAAPSTSPSVTAPPSPGESADARPSPSEPAPSQRGPVIALVRSGEPLAPGRYLREGFAPTITFEISGGEWYAEQLYTGFFDVQQDVDSPDVIAVQFAKPSQVYSEEGSSLAVEDAEGAAAALRGNPGLTVFGDSEGRIGGLEAFVIEVEHAGQTESNVGIMQVPPGPLSIAPDRRLWVAFVDTDDGVLAIMVGGSVARWDEALAAAEPILESVTVGD